jgi:hypothetical protein
VISLVTPKKIPIFYSKVIYPNGKNPTFNEIFCLKLPYPITNKNELGITFHKISFSNENPMPPIGKASLQLSNGSQNISDGSHEIDILHFVTSQAVGSVKFHTFFESCIITTNEKIQNFFFSPNSLTSLFSEEDIDSMILHLFPLLEYIVLEISNFNSFAFSQLISILNLFCDPKYYFIHYCLLYFVKFYAISDLNILKLFPISFLSLFIFNLSSFSITPQSAYVFFCWFYFQLIFKSMVIRQENQISNSDIYEPFLIMLDIYLTFISQTQRTKYQNVCRIIIHHLSYFVLDVISIKEHAFAYQILFKIFSSEALFQYQPRYLSLFLLRFLTPYSFLFLIFPNNSSSLFNSLLIPLIDLCFIAPKSLNELLSETLSELLSSI